MHTQHPAVRVVANVVSDAGSALLSRVKIILTSVARDAGESMEADAHWGRCSFQQRTITWRQNQSEIRINKAFLRTIIIWPSYELQYQSTPHGDYHCKNLHTLRKASYL